MLQTQTVTILGACAPAPVDYVFVNREIEQPVCGSPCMAHVLDSRRTMVDEWPEPKIDRTPQ